MKRFALSVLLFILACAGQAVAGNAGKTLDKLWKKVEDSMAEDRPQKTLKLLDDVIALSVKEHYPWDFCCAGITYYNLVMFRDWKLADSFEKKIIAEAEAFGSPAVEYFIKTEFSGWRVDSMLVFVKANADRLKSARTPEFCFGECPPGIHAPAEVTRAHAVLPDFVFKNISDDYELLLWMILTRARLAYRDCLSYEEVCGLMSAHLSGDSLNRGYLEFYIIAGINDERERIEAMEKFRDKYGISAISLYARSALLHNRFSDAADRMTSGQMHADSPREHADSLSDVFVRLRKDCGDFEKDRAKFVGREADVADGCDDIKALIAVLDDRNIAIRQDEGDTVSVILKNVSEAEFIMSVAGQESQTVFETKITNDSGHYYVADTFRIALPDADDGEYILRCRSGKISAESDCLLYSISGAYRHTADGLSVFAADFMTGEPLSGVRAEVFAGDSLALALDNLDFSVFIPIGEIYSGKEMTYLRFSRRDSNGYLRMSKMIPVLSESHSGGFSSDMTETEEKSDGMPCCRIFRDRSVYEPGDTVHFKGVLYDSDESGLTLWPEGREVELTFMTAFKNVLGKLSLKTDKFGSVAGSFPLPSDITRGRVSVSAKCGEETVSCSDADFIVEDIVLPAYTLDFDETDVVIVPGDTVTVTGRASCYTGHPISGANANYFVKSLYGDDHDISGDLDFSVDGRFSLTFVAGTRADTYKSYEISVLIIGEDGNPHTFDTTLSVSYRLWFDMTDHNAAEGEINIGGGSSSDFNVGYGSSIVSDNMAECEFCFRSASREVPGMKIAYAVSSGKTVLFKGEAVSGCPFVLDFSGCSSGDYVLEAECPVSFSMPGGKDSVIVVKYVHDFALLCDGEESMDTRFESVFKVCDAPGIVLQAGAGNGPVWAVAELFDENLRSLRSELVHLDGTGGMPGSLKTLSWEFKDSYPDNVLLTLFYFKDGVSCSFSHLYSRRDGKTADVPLEFTSFTEKTSPDSEVFCELKTIPDAEVLVAVFDKSTEDISGNEWMKIADSGSREPRMSTPAYPGVHSAEASGYPYLNYESAGRVLLKSRAMDSGSSFGEEYDWTNALPIAFAGHGMGLSETREDFSNTLAFLPFLKTSADSTVKFSFRTSDKLSTYIVSVFVHDRNLNNGVLRRDMLVSKDIMVSLSVPQLLYEGDMYQLKAAVSNASGDEASGLVSFRAFCGTERDSSCLLLAAERPVRLGPGEQTGEIFSVNVPPDVDTLGFHVTYDGGEGDGVFVTVPVFPAEQTLVESHSAVLLPGMSEDSLYSVLQSGFMNVSGYGAEYVRRDLASMLSDALPLRSELVGDDVLSLVESLYAASLAESLSGSSATVCDGDGVPYDVGALSMKLEKYVNSDGGIGWFAGMPSSPAVTACVLDMLGGLKSRGLLDSAGVNVGLLEKAVRYLDSLLFADEKSRGWRMNISLPVYLHIRSMYPEIKFDPGTAGRTDLRTFRQRVRECLDVRGENVLSGRILSKARRISSVMNLSAPEARGLAKELGLSGLRLRRLERNAARDMASLVEYAVPHASGGMYYPNAVMPFRGLMESELYAHSLLCDLLSDYSSESGSLSSGMRGIVPEDLSARAAGIADGIRIWIMVQKETQDWGDDPAFVNAAASVIDGLPSVGGTAILVAGQTYQKPFGDIRTSGNGISISRKYYLEKNASFRQTAFVDNPASVMLTTAAGVLRDGAVLQVGDIVTAVYSLRSDENRSFVRISVPYNASLRPVGQLSGVRNDILHQKGPHSRYYNTFWSPAYREIRPGRILYWLESFPEEESFIIEKFIVTQEGVFCSPVEEIECLYAPHYRANSGYGGKMYVGMTMSSGAGCE